jgi:hypothetical protein
METLRFRAVMKIRESNPYIPISKARVARIKPDWKRPLPVLVRINGKPRKPWRINMMPAGDGTFYLYLHGEVRKASGTGVGDAVEVEVRFDPDYRNGPLHPMPAWFGSALRKHAGARKAWAALPPSRKKEILRYFSRLKGEAARARNLDKALQVLSGAPGRFMARDWRDGA